MVKGSYFKIVLASWLAAFGFCVVQNPQIGASEFIFTTVRDALPIQVLGFLMMAFSILGLFIANTPHRLFLMAIPFSLYVTMALISIVKTNVQDPGLLVILTCPFALLVGYVLDELRRR